MGWGSGIESVWNGIRASDSGDGAPADKDVPTGESVVCIGGDSRGPRVGAKAGRWSPCRLKSCATSRTKSVRGGESLFVFWADGLGPVFRGGSAGQARDRGPGLATPRPVWVAGSMETDANACGQRGGPAGDHGHLACRPAADSVCRHIPRCGPCVIHRRRVSGLPPAAAIEFSAVVPGVGWGGDSGVFPGMDRGGGDGADRGWVGIHWGFQRMSLAAVPANGPGIGLRRTPPSRNRMLAAPRWIVRCRFPGPATAAR